MPFAVENLKVSRKTVDFTDEVLATTEHFPRGDGFVVGSATLRRCPSRPTSPRATAA